MYQIKVTQEDIAKKAGCKERTGITLQCDPMKVCQSSKR